MSDLIIDPPISPGSSEAEISDWIDRLRGMLEDAEDSQEVGRITSALSVARQLRELPDSP